MRGGTEAARYLLNISISRLEKTKRGDEKEERVFSHNYSISKLSDTNLLEYSIAVLEDMQKYTKYFKPGSFSAALSRK